MSRQGGRTAAAAKPYGEGIAVGTPAFVGERGGGAQLSHVTGPHTSHDSSSSCLSKGTAAGGVFAEREET